MFKFQITNKQTDLIHMTVFDKDTLSSSLVGECDLKVQELANKGGTNSWFTIMYKGESAGKVHLDTTWLKD